MMRSLRKRHFQVWLAWAVLMPVAIVFAWLVIPDSKPVKLLQTPSVDILPVIRKTSDKKNYTVNLRANNDNSRLQIEWKNKIPLTVPSAVIYKASPGHFKGGDSESFKVEDALLIGRIEARGDYIFLLKTDSALNELNLILYDFIHEKVIDTVNLKSNL